MASETEKEESPKLRKRKRAQRRRPLTEEEINVPDRQTLIMLGALTTMSLVLWGFAHAGCNYHPPRETRRPRDVKTEELIKDPKNAAIELEYRWAKRDFKGAKEIAAGPLLKELEAAEQKCKANATQCEAEKHAAANAMTTGVVVGRGPAQAKVRVTDHRRAGGGPQVFLMLAERDKAVWKVTGRVVDAPGAQLPPPSMSPFNFVIPGQEGAGPAPEQHGEAAPAKAPDASPAAPSPPAAPQAPAQTPAKAAPSPAQAPAAPPPPAPAPPPG